MRTVQKFLRPRAAALAAVAGAAALMVTAPVFATGDVFYSGRATAVNATVTVNGLKQSVLISDNGMSCQGLPKTETLYTLTNPPPLDVNITEAYTFTQGKDRSSLTKARLSGVNVGVPGLSLNSTLIEARAQASCDLSKVVTLSGKSTVSNLNVNGKPYAITGQPNQSITIPGLAQIIINEQIRYSNEIRVVGVRVKLLTTNTPVTGDIQISAARAKIVCD